MSALHALSFADRIILQFLVPLNISNASSPALFRPQMVCPKFSWPLSIFSIVINALPFVSEQGLNLVYPWGAESGDSWGDGAAFDGDGVGDNASDETNYPYNANGVRVGMPAAFV